MSANKKRPHTYPSSDLDLPITLHEDRHRLEEVEVPIVTISATFRTDIAESFGEKAKRAEEAVFSRAHYSMSIAIFEQAIRLGLSAWLVDPTNYVSPKDYEKILFTELVAEKVARNPLLKKIKDFVDTFARSKLPIAEAVNQPLKYVTEKARFPTISLHYESGNVLAPLGKNVVQVVTDPHVRVNYLQEAERENITFAVFDKETKLEFLEKAKKAGKKVDEERIVVTGPPVDPRIVEAREGKQPNGYTKRPLRLVIATGGLGTNKGEIKAVTKGLIPKIKEGKVNVILYAGTHPDFERFFKQTLKKNNIAEGRLEDIDASARVIYNSSIIKANQALIKHAFAWADGFVTKPSGDMAYDAAASGCFILSLTPWGEWEANIRNRFASLGILERAETGSFGKQLDRLVESGWVRKAIKQALEINPLFLNGAEKIVALQQKGAKLIA